MGGACDIHVSVCSFEKAIEFPQMYHKTLNNLATTYFRLGHLQEAEVRFQESIQRNPDQPMTYNNLGTNHFSTNQLAA